MGLLKNPFRTNYKGFRTKSEFIRFRSKVLDDTANYEKFVAELQKETSNSKKPVWKGSSTDTIRNDLIGSIISGRDSFDPGGRRDIVKRSEAYKIYSKKMEENPNEFETHLEEFKTNDPFVMALLSEDSKIVYMLDEFKHLVDWIGVAIKNAHKRGHPLFANESDARKAMDYIVKTVRCTDWDALGYMFNATSIEDALEKGSEAHLNKAVDEGKSEAPLNKGKSESGCSSVLGL